MANDSYNNKAPVNPYNEKFSSRIRDIKIFLPVNGKNEKEDDLNFVGRERIMERLSQWLSKDGKGSYLVTGFRGMGKTTIVNKVCDKLTKKTSARGNLFRYIVVFAIFIGLSFLFTSLFSLNNESVSNKTHNKENLSCTSYNHCCDDSCCDGFRAPKPKANDTETIGAFGNKNAENGANCATILLCICFVALIFLAVYIHTKWKKHLRIPTPTTVTWEDLKKTCDWIRKKCLEVKLLFGSLFKDGFKQSFVQKINRGRKPDESQQRFNKINIEINLGHEVLHERDILSLIATNIRNEYSRFVKSLQPWSHFIFAITVAVIIGFLSTCICNSIITEVKIYEKGNAHITTINPTVTTHDSTYINDDSATVVTHQKIKQQTSTDTNSTYKNLENDTWLNRLLYNVYQFGKQKAKLSKVLLFAAVSLSLLFLLRWLLGFIPWVSTPRKMLKRLKKLNERIVSVTNIDNGSNPSFDNKILSVSLFNHHRRRTIPLADVREIETELAEIINAIGDTRNCIWGYTAKFIIVFDEMDKIDPAMIGQPKSNEMPEFTDSVKGFPDGMDSRERRRNVLKLLANIKLFINNAQAKFVFISGRELYDAYLADLSDRDFAISSIFTGVLNADSFLTPEGGQTDVRSMSEWYIANRLIPHDWLHNKELTHGHDHDVLKQEKPSLKWYYEYLMTECKIDSQEAAYVIRFLHTFAAYLTHISNGSPKKSFLYFEKYLRNATDCQPMNDWGDTCVAGKEEEREKNKERQKVLYFDAVQQRTINFVYYLANPIMGTITNDLSNYGDRFLVSLSFIIDHIYKHHSRSFSWRNMEQIPDLLKTSKAPELRDSVISIMEYLTQIHISSILIGLNEYKFHKSIAEEISVISKLSDEASAIFNFTLDESVSVIQHNTRLLNYYREMAKDNANLYGGNNNKEYRSIIARIHSNLGDLHYWDEDYYAATLEYRAAIDTLPEDKDTNTRTSFLTKMRCLLKLGLTYEMRKLYPNAYQIYCSLIELIIQKRWVDENDFGLSVLNSYVDDWRETRQTIVYPTKVKWGKAHKYNEQFKHEIYDPCKTKIEYAANMDGLISTFAKDLTPEKNRTINSLTLFEEIRYVYQSILAKLSILEKMGMSGITQTNIEVAEGEFNLIHKSVNIKEKFIISADFFRKLAEILYYKNSLTILSQNQDSLYASVYYGDYDLLAHLDDFCMFGEQADINALELKNDVNFFFNWLNNETADDKEAPRFSYQGFRNATSSSNTTLADLFNELKKYVKELDILKDSESSILKNIPKDSPERNHRIEKMKKNLNNFLVYNIEKVPTNQWEQFFFGSLDYCDYHRCAMRKDNLRPACYACKYYTRSLRILTDNMFDDKTILQNAKTKSLGILRVSFKEKLLYTNSNNIRTLAMTLEGFGNMMFSCASGNNYEQGDHQTKYGINPAVVTLLSDLVKAKSHKKENEHIYDFEVKVKDCKLSRLDKSILYYWDAYRFYLIDACYNEAIGCLKKIMTIFTYYIEVFCYYPKKEKEEHPLCWKEDYKTIRLLIGDLNGKQPFLDELFKLVARHTGYKYDHINLTEINELKWIFSKELSDNIDLTTLSLYPDIRATWLRIAEIKAKGYRYMAKHHNDLGYSQSDYLNHIRNTYPLIAPLRRHETTFYEEVLGYYTKVRYNDHILNNLLGGNPMVDRKSGANGNYANEFHIAFYEKLAQYLSSGEDNSRLDTMIFGTHCDVQDRLDLIEFIIHDTLVCITNMVKIFTPHSHLTSYSKSFIAIVYNYYWEWARKYEFLYSLYQYQEATYDENYQEVGKCDTNTKYDDNDELIKLLNRSDKRKAEAILDSIAGGIRIEENADRTTLKPKLRNAMEKCSSLISNIVEKKETRLRYGLRSDRLYQRLRHEIDDITINTIFSNYTAEMALRYYQLSDEANTEGEAYTEMISSLHFLNDDLNNDTCQFNIACDRFLLNCGVVKEQRSRLENLYKVSQVYGLQKAYIDGPNKINKTKIREENFKRSDWINSELT